MRLLNWAAWFLAATSIDGLQMGGSGQSLGNPGFWLWFQMIHFFFLPRE
jgi:hypothetical protein